MNDNQELYQVNWIIPKSEIPVEDVGVERERLVLDLFHSQTDYLFSKLGLRVDVYSGFSTHDLPLNGLAGSKS